VLEHSRVSVEWMSVMIRLGTVAIFAALVGVFLLLGAVAGAQSATSGIRLAQAADDQAAVVRRARRPARLRIYPNYQPDDVYPHYFPGSNAVRVCNATYVQEFRPSGTVIVPRMSCHWQQRG
jgi:hypothetical protein